MGKTNSRKRNRKTAKPKPPKKVSKYTEKMVPIVEGLAESGKRMAEIAEVLGVDASTFRRWRKEHSELHAAIAEGRKKRADAAEDVLFALAEPHDEIVVREKGVFVEGKNGKPVGAVQRETTTAKDVVSVQALLKLLQAYKPEKYGKKVGVDVGFTFADLAAMAQSDEDS